MQSAELNQAAQLVLSHGYFLMFLAMLIEGPVVTAAGAFAAALGYFNLWFVFLLSVLGNLIPDIIYYALGFWGSNRLVKRYGHYFGLSPEKISRLKGLIERHAGKSLAIIKLTPLLATPGLIVAGATRMDVKKYTWWSLIITAPSSLFFLVVGYYFGAAYEKIVHYVNYGGYVIIFALAIFVALSYLHKKYTRNIAGKIDTP